MKAKRQSHFGDRSEAWQEGESGEVVHGVLGRVKEACNAAGNLTLEEPGTPVGYGFKGVVPKMRT